MTISRTAKTIRFSVILVGISLFLLAGCQAYQPDLRQGQVLKPENVAKVTIGMSRQEVLDILGTPLVTDVFNNHRWDYVYIAYNRDRVVTDRARVTVFFDDDAVVEVESENELTPDSDQALDIPKRKRKGWFSNIKSIFSGSEDTEGESN